MINIMDDTDKVQKKWVWVPCPKQLYKPGYILKEDGSKIQVQSDVSESFSDADVFKMNPTKFDRVEDLASLSHLNEPSVLHNLEKRYHDSIIYTYSGLFLLALNPYHNMNIYNDSIKKRVMAEKSRDGQPHIFVVASEAYRSMITNKENQSILITGESGAGKTENTKKVIEFLAFAAGQQNDSMNNDAFNIESALMSANPILEAFGNAKTIKNDNSSRFGKFIQVKFKGGKICGAKIDKYLMEKSRVTNASIEERSFHIFYYLLKGASQELKDALFLTGNPSDYNCIKHTQHEIANVSDIDEFKNLNNSFAALGITDASIYYKIVAIVLHLSNIRFEETNDSVTIKTNPKYDPLDIVARLLNISADDFLNAILHPTMKAGREVVLQNRSIPQAMFVLEGLMKMLYELLFDSLISVINKKLDSTCDSYIGILDIAGFEIFKSNSFEQLCINYTNEKLQQYFNHHMFILEQEIYKNEEIDWNFIDFGLDLEPTIRTIESSNPIGILSYMDEECVMPCANDKTLLEKLKTVKLVEGIPFKDSFKIKHYAGQVEYEVVDWLRKNKDTESEALLCLIKNSIYGILRHENLNNNGYNNFVKKGAFKTVAQSHKESLKWLMDTLKETQPHFVRCILPNLVKSSELFNKKLVLDQLRCNGVLEGIRISRLGYPTRLTFADFNIRYNLLVDHEDIDEMDPSFLEKPQTVHIINQLKLNKNNYRVGRSLVFFRQGIIADLEELRDKKIQNIAEAIQNLIRSKIAIRRLTLDSERMNAAMNLQRNSRLCLNLLRWKWWALYIKVQPLLDVKKAEKDKKIFEEQLQAHLNLLEQNKVDLSRKDKEISDLQVDIDNLKTDLSKKDNQAADREELLESLRIENSRIQGFVSEIKERDAAILSLKDKIDLANIKEDNHCKEHGRLLDKIDGLQSDLSKKEAEIESFIKQDLGTVLKIKDKEIQDLKNSMAVLEKSNSTLILESKNQKSLIDQKMKESANLQSKFDQKVKEFYELQTRYDSDLVDYSRQAEEDRILLSKLRAELADLQLENDNYSTKCIHLECTNQSHEENIKGIKQDLEYQKARNQSLEASIQSLKNLKSTHTSECANCSKEKAESVDVIMWNKTMNSLKTKLAFEQKMNAKLTEEKDALYDENLKLMQSKLDELFSSENEYNVARAQMQTEIRRLEAENSLLRKDLASAQNVSDCSDDSSLDKIALLLEEEKGQRKILDMKIIELENANVKLNNTIDGLKGELTYLKNINQQNLSNSITKNDLNLIKDDLNFSRKCINSIASTFQNDFFNIMNEKDGFCNALIEKYNISLTELDAMSKKLEELNKNYSSLDELYDNLKKKHSQATNELESLRVSDKANAVTIAELKQHISRLEETFNEREDSIETIRQKYCKVVEELENRKTEYIQQIGILRSRVIDTDKKNTYEEAVQAIRKSSHEKISQLSKENDLLRIQNEEVNMKIHKIDEEKNDLKRLIDDFIVKNESIKITTNADKTDFNDLIKERLVSSLIVDKDALKAMEWKNIVASKCPRCFEFKKEVVSCDYTETCKLNSEISLLNLKVKQSDRIIEENKKIVDAMKSCMVVLRKSRNRD